MDSPLACLTGAPTSKRKRSCATITEETQAKEHTPLTNMPFPAEMDHRIERKKEAIRELEERLQREREELERIEASTLKRMPTTVDTLETMILRKSLRLSSMIAAYAGSQSIGRLSCVSFRLCQGIATSHCVLDLSSECRRFDLGTLYELSGRFVLTGMRFSSTLTAPMLACVDDLFASDRIQRLNFSCCKSNMNPVIPRCISLCSNLTYLDISNCDLSIEFEDLLCDNPKLKHLIAPGCSVLPVDMAHLEPFNLQTLDLRRCILCENDLDDIALSTDLEVLHIDHTKITSQDLTPFSDLTNLRVLTAHGCDELTGNISSLAPLVHLETLQLCGVTGTLEALQSLSRLTSLVLNGSDKGKVSGDLEQISHLTQLKEFSVSNSDVTGALSNLAASTRLTDIRVDRSNITGSIFDVLFFPKLVHLSIFASGVLRPEHEVEALKSERRTLHVAYQ